MKQNIGIRGWNNQVIETQTGSAEQFEDFIQGIEQNMEGWIDREHQDYIDHQVGHWLTLAVDIERSIEEYGEDFDPATVPEVKVWYNIISEEEDEMEWGVE